jgi:hypothetical protein
VHVTKHHQFISYKGADLRAARIEAIADVLATINPPVQKQLHYDSASLLAGRATV